MIRLRSALIRLPISLLSLISVKRDRYADITETFEEFDQRFSRETV